MSKSRMPEGLKAVVENETEENVGKIYITLKERTIAQHNFKKGCEFMFNLFDDLVEEQESGKEKKEPAGSGPILTDI